VIFGITAVNLLVLGGWRVRGWRPFMTRYFTSSPVSKSICLPMLFSTFSHNTVTHFAVNMFVLYSFGNTSVSVFGKEQFLAFYLSAGVFASLGSLAFKVLTGITQGSVGASGAILGIIASHCLLFPHSQIQIIFLPFFAFSAATALKGVMVMDFLGMVLRWSFFDHAGHFAGALFGM
jgi:rhomboid-like protein